MDRHIARVNRVGLAVVGMVLILCGLAALARGLGVLGPAHVPVTSGPLPAYALTPWFWPAVALVALVAELLALRWLLLQGRRSTIHHLDLERDPGHGTTHISARAAAEALEDDLAESVHEERPAESLAAGEAAPARAERVHATLGGAPADPRLALAVTLPDEADPAAAGRAVQRAVARFRESLETDRLPAVVRLHTVRTHPF
ncbi:alkaline shock response membrane anchor protein AmaP [Sphaerisporangium fuscum]|uniref:alkaline shock response membrane anchor protein AmaP n=1 Tax=Sphaerisporangium fuscum TaxID=2835868 RepID=UPI001BDCFDD7|nr:alkaline shock response membrane anchor protein AmaP [Sphaerisporangium fuscum]